MMKQNYVTLNDGNKIPQFGLGVYMVRGDEPLCRWDTVTLTPPMPIRMSVA
mgnify:CR=1 FL=1